MQIGFNGLTYYLHKTNQKAADGSLSWKLLSNESQLEWAMAAIAQNEAGERKMSGTNSYVSAQCKVYDILRPTQHGAYNDKHPWI